MRDPPPTNWSVLVNKSSRITVAQYLSVETVENPVKLANRWLTSDKKTRHFSKFNSVKAKLAYLRSEEINLRSEM